MAIAIDFVFINDDDLSRQIKNDFSPQVMQGGPLPVLNGVITPVSRIITPVGPSYLFIRPVTGVITPLITSRGPPYAVSTGNFASTGEKN